MATPLAELLRPQTIDDIVGQTELLKEGGVLQRIIKSKTIPNMIFYGPSGIGKTTTARIIAESADMWFRSLNGTNASINDIKDIITEADSLMAQNGVLLYLDEIQYFNKKQQQSLLEYIENGKITLIASTTENPYFYVYNAILSRCTVFEFKPVSSDEIKKALVRAVGKLETLYGKIEISDEVLTHIANSSGGDVRKSLNALELCVLSAKEDGDKRVVEIEHAKLVSQKSNLKYDKDGDQHYDLLSAFQKSLRGSDPNAALHYLARLLESGDMTSVIRRLLVCSCEDMGLAYPQGVATVKAMTDIALQVGMPEARIPLADAVVLVATAPKSNSAYMAFEEATADLKSGKNMDIPLNVKDAHYAGASKMGRGVTYLYPHAYDNNYVNQQYLPDEYKESVYYHFGHNKSEQAAKIYWKNIKDKNS